MQRFFKEAENGDCELDYIDEIAESIGDKVLDALGMKFSCSDGECNGK
nr:hypothetical protein [uncultured Ruminococcus sp.]